MKFEFTYSRASITFLDNNYIKMKMEHCAPLYIENQVIVVFLAL